MDKGLLTVCAQFVLPFSSLALFFLLFVFIFHRDLFFWLPVDIVHALPAGRGSNGDHMIILLPDFPYAGANTRFKDCNFSPSFCFMCTSLLVESCCKFFFKTSVKIPQFVTPVCRHYLFKEIKTNEYVNNSRKILMRSIWPRHIVKLYVTL